MAARQVDYGAGAGWRAWERVTVERLGYRAGLDGLRGVAVLLVLAGHARVPGFVLGGDVGVEVFFVLSGFLITTLLLEEHATTSEVDLRRFYLRRARRLLPALVVVLAVVAVVGSAADRTGVAGGASYTANLARARSIDLGVLNHLWSLAVEEHFYLLWPLVVVACGGRDRLVGMVAVAGMVVTALWRFDLARTGATWDRLYNGTDTRITGILVGAVVSVAVRYGLRLRTAGVGVVALAWLMTGFLVETQPFRWGYLAVDLAAALVIVGVTTSRFRLLELRPLVWCGAISYALYLWHYPLHRWFGLVGVPLAFAAAGLSGRWVEARFRHRLPVAAR